MRVQCVECVSVTNILRHPLIRPLSCLYPTEKKEAAKLKFTKLDDALLIAVHYKHGFPPSKSERDPIWEHYRRHMRVDRPAKAIWNRLKLLKEDGDLSKIREKVIDVFEEDSPILVEYMGSYGAFSKSRKKDVDGSRDEEGGNKKGDQRTVTFDDEINADLN